MKNIFLFLIWSLIFLLNSKSVNAEFTWVETFPTGTAEDRDWIGTASDSTGSHLVAAVYGGRIYTSANGGSSWAETFPTGSPEDKTWAQTSLNSSGSQLLVVGFGDRVYVGTNVPDPTPTPTPVTKEISGAVKSTPSASNPNIKDGWKHPIMAGSNFIGIHGFIPNSSVTSDPTRLASVFIDKTHPQR